MTIPVHAHTLHCTDPHCHLPAGRIVNGSLVFTARHNGKKHECVVSLDWLRDQLERISLTKRESTVLDSATTALSPSR